MSSIFNGSYSESIRRVNTNSVSRTSSTSAETKPLGGVKSNAADQTEKFSNVLTNIQNSANSDPGARGSLGYQPLEVKKESPSILEDQISNLTITESQTLIETNTQPLALNQRGLGTYKISNSELTLDNAIKGEVEVARLNPDRKAIQLPPAVQGKPPAAPKLISAKLNAPETPKPVLPSVSSTKEPIAMNEQLLEELIGAAGRYHGIDPNLSVAVARAESSLKVNAVSSDGHHSKGIFQLLDNTGREMMNRLDVNGHYEPFDPKLNAHLGVGYLRRLHDLFSKETNLGSNLKTVAVKSGTDLEKISIAAFNAGEGRVARAQAQALKNGENPASYKAIENYLPLSTRTYVQRVSNLKSLAEARDDETSIA